MDRFGNSGMLMILKNRNWPILEALQRELLILDPDTNKKKPKKKVEQTEDKQKKGKKGQKQPDEPEEPLTEVERLQKNLMINGSLEKTFLQARAREANLDSVTIRKTSNFSWDFGELERGSQPLKFW